VARHSRVNSGKMRSGYKHYRNSDEPGVSAYITSTILDFVFVFSDPLNADLMAGSLLSDIHHCGGQLFAFVVMGHHIHLLAVAPENMTMSQLMDRVKSNSGRRIKPYLSDGLLAKLSIQKGLNKRSIWQRSFRGLPINGRKMFAQKVNYIHMNPVRAGLCERPQDYRWSSRWMYDEGKVDWERGIVIDDALIRHFCDPELLDLWKRKKRKDEAGQ
jgi:putative transposase